MHTVVLLHRCYPSTPHGVGPWLPAPYPTQEVTMSCTTSTPTARDYQLAHERVLETLWLNADDLDLPFSAYVAQVAEPMWLISYTNLVHLPVPTEHGFARWIESEAHHLAFGSPF